MAKTVKNSCAQCPLTACKSGDTDRYPVFCPTQKVRKGLLKETLKQYEEDDEVGRLAKTSAYIEGEFYGKLTRVEETIEFIKRMGYKKVGIASCVGLMRETGIFVRILNAHGIKSFTVGCKIGAVDKTKIGIPEEKKVNGGCGHESLCNPIMQAKTLEKEKCDFNLVIGLCVGHDSLFLKYSAVPASVLVVKDRVLGHNPVQALYTAGGMYSRFKDVGM